MKGLVLAGGKGKRMGLEKAGILHRDGRTFLERSIGLLRAAGCEEVVVALREEQEVPRGAGGVCVVRDPGVGPLCGIIAGLETDPGTDWTVIACDLPELDVATLRGLTGHGEMFVCYRSEFDGGLEPLCSFYGKGSLEILKKGKAAGEWKLRKMMEDHGVKVLNLENKGALANANRPEDLRSGIRVDEIWISKGHDFRGRHGLGRCKNEIVPVDEVECVAGRGLRGDRYFDFKENFKGQVTFFPAEVLAELRGEYGDISSSVLRRNIVVAGVDLKQLIGKAFNIQGVLFEGSEECKPCYWMDEAVGPGAEDFLKGDCRGGLRARILTNGRLERNS